MNQESYHNLISGQAKGFAAASMRAMLSSISLLYKSAVDIRNFLYDRNILKIHRLETPVISIGNITAGGTGKTPLVIWLCKYLQQKNLKTAILTRGYTKGKDEISDEAQLISSACPGAEVIVNPDRYEGALEALTENSFDVFILDDGFQHRRLYRDIDIITIDATEPFGFARQLPSGMLREPLPSIKRASAAIITRCDQQSKNQLEKIENKLKNINPNIKTAKSVHAPVCVKSAKDEQIALQDLQGRKIAAFCGIGNPNAFFNTLKSLNADLVATSVFDDHHPYTESDIADIFRLSQEAGARMVITTQKDFTRIPQSSMENNDLTLAYLVIELKISEGKEIITQLIENVIESKIS